MRQGAPDKFASIRQQINTLIELLIARALIERWSVENIKDAHKALSLPFDNTVAKSMSPRKRASYLSLFRFGSNKHHIVPLRQQGASHLHDFQLSHLRNIHFALRKLLVIGEEVEEPVGDVADWRLYLERVIAHLTFENELKRSIDSGGGGRRASHSGYGAQEFASEPLYAARLRASSVTDPGMCLGRTDDIQRVVDAIAIRGNSILVYGGAGIGKTTLIRKAAMQPEVVRLFGDRRWVVALESSVDANACQFKIAQSIGLAPSATLDDIAAQLGRVPSLLLLDNLDTPLNYETRQPAERRGVEALLKSLMAIPGVTLLASQRGNGRLTTFRWREQISLEPLSASDARRLFALTALNLDESRLYDIPADSTDLDFFVEEMGGLPLGIVLVALRIATEFKGDLSRGKRIWQEFGAAFAVRPGLGSNPQKIDTLAASIEFSLQSPRIGEAGRILFSLLGQLPAGIAEPDLWTLLSGTSIEAAGQLSTVGLARALPYGRIGLLPPIRDYAHRHYGHLSADIGWAEHFTTLLHTEGNNLGRLGGHLSAVRIADEYPNISAALRYQGAEQHLDHDITFPDLARVARFIGIKDPGLIRQLIKFVGERLHTRRLYSLFSLAIAEHEVEFDVIVDSLLSITYDENTVEGGKILISAYVGLCRIIVFRYKYVDVRGFIGNLIRCAARFSDIEVLAEALHLFSLVVENDIKANALELRAIRLFRQIGLKSGEATSFEHLAKIAYDGGDTSKAAVLTQLAISLCNEAGLLSRTAYYQFEFAVQIAKRRPIVARAMIEDARSSVRKVNETESAYEYAMGVVAKEENNFEVAFTHFHSALSKFKSRGNHRGQALCWYCLSELSIRRRDEKNAREYIRKSKEIFIATEDNEQIIACDLFLGWIELIDGHWASARESFEHARTLAIKRRSRFDCAKAELGLALAGLAQDDSDSAITMAQHSVSSFVALGRIEEAATAADKLASYSIKFELLGLTSSFYQQARVLWEQAGSPDQVRRIEQLEREFGNRLARP